MGIIESITNAFTPAPKTPARSNIAIARGVAKTRNVPLQNFLLGKGVAEHLTDLEQAEEIYLTVPLIKAAVDKKVNAAMTLNYILKSENAQAKDAIAALYKAINFNQIRRKHLLSKAVYGFSAWEKIGKKLQAPDGTETTSPAVVSRLKYIDPKTFYVKRNELGEIVSYVQKVGHSEIELNKDDIVYVPGSPLGNSPYGISDIMGALGSRDNSPLKNKLAIEKAARKLMEKYVNVPIHVKVGAAGEQVQASEVQAVQSALESMRNDAHWATSSDVDIQAVSYAGKVIEYKPLLDHFELQVIYAMQVPQVLLGDSSVPEGLANIQMEAFKLTVMSDLENLEEAFETQLNKPYLAAFGIEDHVEIDWEDFSDIKDAELIKLKDLLSVSSLSAQTKADLENKIRAALGFEGVITPEQLTPAPSPFGGGQPFFREETKEQRQRVLEMKFPFTLSPQVVEAFDLQAAVVQFLQGYAFAEITANVDAIPALRSVLLKGVQQGLSIQQMTNELTQSMGADKAFDAERLVRTELARAENQTALQIFKESPLVKKVQWIAADDDRTDDLCLELDGKVFDPNNAPTPPLHPACRCTLVPQLQ